MAGVEVADGAGRRVCVVVCDVQNGWGDCRRRPYRVCMAGEEEEEEKKPNDRQTTRATTRRHDETIQGKTIQDKTRQQRRRRRRRRCWRGHPPNPLQQERCPAGGHRERQDNGAAGVAGCADTTAGNEKEKGLPRSAVHGWIDVWTCVVTAGWLAGRLRTIGASPPNLPPLLYPPVAPRQKTCNICLCKCGRCAAATRPANGNLCRKGQQRVVLDPSPWPQGCRGCCDSGGARAQQDRGRLEWARLEQGGTDQIRAEGGGSLDQSCGPAVL